MEDQPSSQPRQPEQRLVSRTKGSVPNKEHLYFGLVSKNCRQFLMEASAAITQSFGQGCFPHLGEGSNTLQSPIPVWGPGIGRGGRGPTRHGATLALRHKGKANLQETRGT